MDSYQTRFSVLIFTDIVGSTALKARHGVPAFAAALRIHNAHFERIAHECRGVRILHNMGDGYFAEGDSVAEVVKFALLFQNAMREEPWGEVPLTTRVGIHAGEISMIEAEGGSGIVAPAADLAARVMSLALGGQILLTRFPFDEGRHFIREHPPVAGKSMPPLRWLAHGPYLLSGRDEPMDIFEVGADGLAPLTPPPDGEKARRAIRLGEEVTLGWRPAVGLEIPGRTGWHLTERLGAGGFGEVWTGEHAKLSQRRAFKFCFDDERLRALKREVTIVRLLRTALGDRDDIVRFHELKLDAPPFYLESDLAPHGNLLQWAVREGGLEKISLVQRIALVAHTARALAAAHSIGVLHKDIKPTNILIFDAPEGGVRPRLVDFGIGTLADLGVLAREGITGAGFTRMTIQHSTGTPTYSPPEYQAGRPYTIQGDIYGLGVLLYQLVTGMPNEPLAPGWERDIADPLLREDIATCVDGDPARRFPSAADLADRLFRLDERRAAVELEKSRTLELERKAYRRGIFRAAAVAAVIVVLFAALGLIAVREAKRTEAALNDLKKTAPTFHAVAKSLVNNGKLDEAIEKLGYAIQLDDANADYRLFHANLLEAMQRLTESIAEYRFVLTLRPDDASAKVNLALCDRLIAENGSPTGLRKDLQKQLLDSLRLQNRLLEAGPLNAIFEPDIAIAEAAIDARLSEYKNQVGWKMEWGKKRVNRLPDGTFSLDLSCLKLSDFSPFKGLPISEMNLGKPAQSDSTELGSILKSLSGLPLKKLRLWEWLSLSDLSPLYGLNLESLELSNTKVQDLGPLKGMKLTKLDLDFAPVSDLSPLAGMPLTNLGLTSTYVADLTPLKGAPLRFLNISSTRVTDITPLSDSPLFHLVLLGTGISDLSPLADCSTLKELHIYATKVSDLTPLSKLQLTWLECHWSLVKSLEPIRGQPLRHIVLTGAPIKDISPLADCPELEYIALSNVYENINVLRKLPKLKMISSRLFGNDLQMTTTEFWKKYDESGQSAEEAGDYERAAELYKRDIEHNPNSSKSYNALGYMWIERNEHLDEAGELIKKALSISPESRLYIDSLGWYYFRKGDYERALQELLRAQTGKIIQHFGDDPTNFDHIGETYLKLGKPVDALISWSRSLAIEENEKISEKIKAVEQMLQKKYQPILDH